MSLYCNIVGHQFKVSKKVTCHVSEYKCSNCKKQLTTNSNGYLVELTPKYKDINHTLHKMHSKRQASIRREALYIAYDMVP